MSGLKRQGRTENHSFFGSGVDKTQIAGMQQQPLSRLPTPVQAVADNGTIQAHFMGCVQS